MRAYFLPLLLLLLSAPAWADHFGKVVAVHDGDTLTILIGRAPLKVRLVEIDAPELHQAFGQRSRQSLQDLCFGYDAKIEGGAIDRYGRILGRVSCAGHDANTAQVRRGMAWVYDRYVTDRALYEDQTAARQERRGLWADPSPLPPWEWRKAGGPK